MATGSNADEMIEPELVNQDIYRLKLPNSTVETEDIFDGCKQYLELHFGQNWQNKIVELPVMRRCSWEGPTGLASGSVLPKPGESQSLQEGFVAGYNAESIVFNHFKRCLGSAGEKAVIVNGPKLSVERLQVINQMFDIDLPLDNPSQKQRPSTVTEVSVPLNTPTEATYSAGAENSDNPSGKHSETGPLKPFSTEFSDIIIIAKNFGVIVIEAKSSSVGKAHKQVTAAEAWIQTFLAALRTEGDSEILVHRIIALPNAKAGEIAKSHYRPDVFTYFTQESFLESSRGIPIWLESIRQAAVLDGRRYEQLTATFLILLAGEFRKCQKRASRMLHLRTEDLSLAEANAGLLETLSTQKYLEPAWQIQLRSQKSKLKAENETWSPRKKLKATPKIYAGCAPEGTGISIVEKPKESAKKHPQDAGPAKPEATGASASDGETRKRNQATSKQHCWEFRQLILLTPEQTAVMESPRRKLILDGYASTGKTVLLQSKILRLLQDETDKAKILVLVPESLISWYVKFFRENLANDDSIVGQRLIFCDIEAFMQVSGPNVAAAHVFCDEYQATAIGRDSSIVHALNSHIREAWNSPNYFWITRDSLQTNVTERQSIPSLVGSLEWEAELDSFSCLNDMRFHGNDFFLTSALRGTVQVYQSWMCCVNSRFLRQGHNVCGRETERVNFERGNYGDYSTRDELTQLEATMSLVCNKILEAVEAAINQRGWTAADIAVLIVDVDLPRSRKLRSLITTFLESKYKIAMAKDRGTAGNAVTVDFQTNAHSLEWPVVITTASPDIPVIGDVYPYVGRSRCIAELINIEGIDKRNISIGSLLSLQPLVYDADGVMMNSVCDSLICANQSIKNMMTLTSDFAFVLQALKSTEIIHEIRDGVEFSDEMIGHLDELVGALAAALHAYHEFFHKQRPELENLASPAGSYLLHEIMMDYSYVHAVTKTISENRGTADLSVNLKLLDPILSWWAGRPSPGLHAVDASAGDLTPAAARYIAPLNHSGAPSVLDLSLAAARCAVAEHIFMSRRHASHGF